MRLSGWQRLGIIASVLYAVGMFLFKLDQQTKLAVNYARIGQELCLTATTELTGSELHQKCNEMWHTDFNVMGGDRFMVASVFALAPIPFAWLFAWIARGLYRWVRRGFQQQAS